MAHFYTRSSLTVARWAFHHSADIGHNSMYSHWPCKSCDRFTPIAELCRLGWVASPGEYKIVIPTTPYINEWRAFLQSDHPHYPRLVVVRHPFASVASDSQMCS